MNKHTVKRHRFIHKNTFMSSWFEDELWDHGLDPYDVISYTVRYDIEDETFPMNITYTNTLGNINSTTIPIPTRTMFQYE